MDNRTEMNLEVAQAKQAAAGLSEGANAELISSGITTASEGGSKVAGAIDIWEPVWTKVDIFAKIAERVSEVRVDQEALKILPC